MTAPSAGHVIRLTQTRVERQLFLQRTILIGVRRNWAAGSKAIFVRRQEALSDNISALQDYFIGFGIVKSLVPFTELSASERQKCMENNCYGKITFRILVRFIPPVAESSIPSRTKKLEAGEEPQLPLQTGDALDLSDIDQIEQLASVRIIS